MADLGTRPDMFDSVSIRESDAVQHNDDRWSHRFRRVQRAGAKLAVDTGVDVKDVPAVLRQERAERDVAELAEAKSFVAARLTRRGLR